jgi:hypothetical protein
MHRRSLLRLIATTISVLPVRPWQAWAQSVTFPGNQSSTLEALGFVVLPSSLGQEGVLRAVRSFETWVKDYRPGADTDHGYGHTRVVPLPASPAPAYLEQLRILEPSLASTDAQSRRVAVLDALRKAGVTDLAPYGRGKHVAADLMSHYFLSSEANDACYGAAIQRYECRGLKNSDRPPLPLHDKRNAHNPSK